MEKYFIVKNTALNGIVAGLYVALTIACGPLSYEFMQFSFSELFDFFVFFNSTTTVGHWDILHGTATTFVACVLMILYYKITNYLRTYSLPDLSQ